MGAIVRGDELTDNARAAAEWTAACLIRLRLMLESMGKKA